MSCPIADRKLPIIADHCRYDAEINAPVIFGARGRGVISMAKDYLMMSAFSIVGDLLIVKKK